MSTGQETLLPTPEPRHLASKEDFEAAHKALWDAIGAMETARVKCSGLGSEPARSLSISITQTETASLWLKRAREHMERGS